MITKYSEAQIFDYNKGLSRRFIARDIKTHAKTNGDGATTIFYLGGVNPHLLFESYFKGNVVFHRWEELPCVVPDTYNTAKRHFHNKTLSAKTYDKACESCAQGEHDSQYVWLDFCGTPNDKALDLIKHVLNHPLTSRVYVTVLLNPRNTKNGYKEAFTYTNTNTFSPDVRLSLRKNEVAQFIASKLDANVKCMFAYRNGCSPMGVFRVLTNRKKKMMKTSQTEKTKTIQETILTLKAELKMLEKRMLELTLQQPATPRQAQSKITQPKTTRKTVYDYVKLAGRFSNKQIAYFWNMPLMRIAGLAAAAKRMKLV